MNGSGQLTELLRRKTPERGRPFLLTGAILGAVPEEALIGIGLTPDKYPSVYNDPELLARLSLYINDIVGHSNLSLPCVVRAESEDYGGERDLHGTDPATGEISSDAFFEYPLKKIADYKNLKLLEKGGRTALVIETVRLLKRARPGLPLVGDLVGALSLATSLIDAATLLRAVPVEGELLREFLDMLTENTIDFAVAQVRAGADAFYLVDPFATAEVIGAEYFARFAVPYLNRIAKGLAEQGCPLIVHICGDPLLLAGLPAQLECAALALHGTQDVLAAAGGKLLVGGIEVTALLGLEGSEPPQRAVTRSVGGAALSGFDVIAPSCSLDSTTSLAALRAVAKAALVRID